MLVFGIAGTVIAMISIAAAALFGFLLAHAHPFLGDVVAVALLSFLGWRYVRGQTEFLEIYADAAEDAARARSAAADVQQGGQVW